MAKITYLIGAGASVNALPTVSEMESRLRIFQNYLLKFTSIPGVEEYIQDIEDSIIDCSGNTIDEYANSLYRDRGAQQKYNKLKAILIGFFLFEQLKKKQSDFAINNVKSGPTVPAYSWPNKFNSNNELNERIQNTLDRRYSGFLGKVLNPENKFKPDINILSWNYDSQFEIAMERLSIPYKHLDAYVDIFPYPMQIDFNEFKESERSHNILKLNGTAGIFKNKGEIISVYDSQQEYFDDIIDIIMNIYKESKTRLERYNPLFNFAWERNIGSEYVLSRAKRMVKETEILVVIGYSFPDFNRDIDRQIFSGKSISKVYLQVNNDPSVILNMRGLKNDFYQKTESVQNCSSFFIPPEF
ncbi:hypothetical protein EFY79_16815 [Hanamia caeni]|uniref:SIR2-like domain-containing protein n=1 Tax=Hanamia caeni TaxID=2294116 RepID=A0A3M9N8A9_9BACT|nr:hypothetical protein [Hanamia caeni]RNI33971.1 hypothetical protein EFY79_16815 [Hanamia caeni]